MNVLADLIADVIADLGRSFSSMIQDVFIYDMLDKAKHGSMERLEIFSFACIV